jgi:hypothetical protein
MSNRKKLLLISDGLVRWAEFDPHRSHHEKAPNYLGAFFVKYGIIRSGK